MASLGSAIRISCTVRNAAADSWCNWCMKLSIAVRGDESFPSTGRDEKFIHSMPVNYIEGFHSAMLWLYMTFAKIIQIESSWLFKSLKKNQKKNSEKKTHL